jgi:hypothetical protein
MQTRTRDRLKALEEKIAPKRSHFVFISFDEPSLPPRADRLAAFRAENSIAPGDPIHEVSITFA